MRHRERYPCASNGEQAITPRHTRHGFTLVEVLVAIAIGGLVLLGARALLEVLADEEQHLTHDTATQDARSNGYRTLRSFVGQMEVGTTESGLFSGDPRSTSFTTWCDVPSGWQERCAITLVFEREEGELALVARLPRGRHLVLARDFSAGEFRYLYSAASGGQWFGNWGRGTTAPLAIGVILERGTPSDEGGDEGIDSASRTPGREIVDTLIVRIGERG